MNNAVIMLAAFLSGCATDGMRIDWRQLDRNDVNKTCGAMAGPLDRGNFWGCSRITPGLCTVYTDKVGARKDREINETLGHEVRHCFHGNWH